MKSRAVRLLSAFLVLCLLLTAAPLSFFSITELFPQAYAYATGEYIQYGTYPQSQVTDSALIKKLDAAQKTWKSYGYYSGTGNTEDGKMTPYDDMHFADFFWNGEKYRAVTFGKYRPYNTGYGHGNSYSYQDDNGYTVDRVYYFRYEPILWRILDPNEGLIVTDRLLDAQAFHNTLYYADGYWQDDSCSVFEGNYAASSVRVWLNQDFYESAFTDAQKENIRKDVLRSDPADSASVMRDGVFLLSYNDLRNSDYGFLRWDDETDAARMAMGTDYAKAQGLWVNRTAAAGYSWWWTRSSDEINGITVADENGLLHAGDFANAACGGIRAACKLSELKNDAQISPKLYSAGGAETQRYIAVFSDERSLTVETGKTMWLGFGLEENDTTSEFKRMALSLSNPSIVSISDYQKKDFGYYVKVTGLKPGDTDLTITDPDTGTTITVTLHVFDKYARTLSYEIENMPKLHVGNLSEKKIETNIYDLNGIYINQYSCKKAGDKYQISLDAYNARYYIGAIDIYDADGNWIKSKPIDKHTNISSLWEEGVGFVALAKDAFNGKFLTYDQPSYSKKTERITFEVPVGGRFTISNNMATSIGTLLFNGIDIALRSISGALNAAVDTDLKITEFEELFEEKLAEAPDLTEILITAFFENAAEKTEKVSSLILNGKVEAGLEQYINFIQELINEVDAELFSTENLCEFITGMGQSALETVLGPAGTAMKGMFAVGKGTSELTQVVEMARSTGNTCVNVYTDVEEGYVNSDGIVVNTNGNMDAEAVLQVFRVYSDPAADTIDFPSDNYELYNICFVKNDKTVQPNGKVTVMIPIPTGMQGETCAVYRQEEDGSWTALEAHRQGAYLVFETDHFSMYAVVGERASLTVLQKPWKSVYAAGESLDTAGMILSLGGLTITQGYVCSPAVFAAEGTQTVTVYYGHSSAVFSVTVEQKHHHDAGVWTVTQEATCTVSGVRELRCGICGAVLRTDTIPATGHAWGEWTIVEQPTCMYEGTAERICGNNTAHREIQMIDRIDHYDADGDGYCDMCGTYMGEPEIRFVLGDTDNDGRVTAADARTALRIAVNLEYFAKSDPVYNAADADEDGSVTAADARLILRASVGLEYLVREMDTFPLVSSSEYEILFVDLYQDTDFAVMQLKLVNHTDKTVCFSFDDFAVNSYMLKCFYNSKDIPPHSGIACEVFLEDQPYVGTYSLTPIGEIRWNYTVFEQDPADAYCYYGTEQGQVRLIPNGDPDSYRFVPSFDEDVYFQRTSDFKLAYAGSEVNDLGDGDRRYRNWLFACNLSSVPLEFDFEVRAVNGIKVPEDFGRFIGGYRILEGCSSLMNVDLYYYVNDDWHSLLKYLDIEPQNVRYVDFTVTVKNADNYETIYTADFTV